MLLFTFTGVLYENLLCTTYEQSSRIYTCTIFLTLPLLLLFEEEEDDDIKICE